MAGIWIFVPLGYNPPVVWNQPAIPQPSHINLYPLHLPSQCLPPPNHHQIVSYTSYYHSLQVYTHQPLPQYMPPAQVYQQHTQHFHQTAPYQPYQYPAHNHNFGGRGGSQALAVQRQRYSDANSEVIVPWCFPAGASPALKEHLMSRWNQSKILGQPKWRGVRFEAAGFQILQGRAQKQESQSKAPQPMSVHQPPPSISNLANNNRVEDLDNIPLPVQEKMPLPMQEKTPIPRTPSQNSPSNKRQNAKVSAIKATKQPKKIRDSVIATLLKIKREDALSHANSNLRDNDSEIKSEDTLSEANLNSTNNKEEENFENRTRTRLRSGTQAPRNYADDLRSGKPMTDSRKRKAATVESERKKPRGYSRVKDELDH